MEQKRLKSALRGYLADIFEGFVVLPERFELSTSPLPRECSTPELRQHKGGREIDAIAP